LAQLLRRHPGLIMPPVAPFLRKDAPARRVRPYVRQSLALFARGLRLIRFVPARQSLQLLMLLATAFLSPKKPVLAVDPVVREATLFPIVYETAGHGRIAVCAGKTLKGMNMKLTFSKSRLASGCMALAVAAGLA